MNKIIKYKLTDEVNARLQSARFGESNNKCVVVRLNNDLTEKNSIQESTFKLRAHGFKTNKINAEASSFVILTDTKESAILGSIVKVESNDTDEKRVNIYFRDPSHIELSELNSYLSWNNSNPVRIIEI